ncbi:MAG: hypoxanthine phosphoribosyltransferase [Chloroflexi bacterium]|nr:hypoxanthine phosphoribosyltransferase [Chloroflexota bacterium]MCI0649895.1 hypoxanthine phosphoribosyltransferase [Chloroflexota bacterium]MCI0725665.1 hypoxanthine phosphoribosyltransferase [Chloroflexota bacterium]
MVAPADRDLHQDIDRVLIADERLQARVREMGRQIEIDYRGIDDLLLICVLKGAFVFLADLSRALHRPHQLDFMGISSYGSGTQSSGAVRIVLDLKQDIAGRHVLIVEDIIDSGRTLDYMRRNLLARSPASLRICALLDKPARREVDVPVDYVGFHIPDAFVVGYGLDFSEIYRNLPFIAVLKPEVFAG